MNEPIAQPTGLVKIFGRDPVLWLQLVAGAVAFISAFLTPISGPTQGLINAAALAVVGVITAFIVHDGSAVPAIVGLFKAAIALGLAFGLKWSPEQQTEVIFMVQATLGLLVRQQVTAPINAFGDRVTQRIGS